MKASLTRSLSLALLIAIPAFANAQTELKGSPEELRNFLHPQENVVTLSADAEETAYSDEAIVSLVVKTEEKQLAASIQRNSELRENIRKSLLASGMKNSDINNSKFSSTPQYGWFGKEPDSYEVVNRVAVTISNEEQLKTLAGLVDKYKEVSMANTEFKHTGKEEYQKKVKQQAMDKIMAQKKIYEANLNVKLVPIAFRDQPILFAPTRGAAVMEDAMVSQMKMERSVVASAPAYSEPAPTSFDEVKYSANISVDFKIESN